MRSIGWIVGCLLLVFLCGCDLEKLKESQQVSEDGFVIDEKPHFVVTLNQLVKYPHAENIEKEVECFDGNTIWINTNYMLHSKNIEKVELIPFPENPQYYSLKLKLDRRGKLLWMQSSIGLTHTKIALLVDGICYRIFKAKEMDDKSDWVVIDGPFNKYLSKGVAFYSESNYKFFNPATDSFF